MIVDEANITVDYLKEMQEEYIEGEGYERHPLPEWFALDKAIQVIEQITWIPCSKKLPEKNVKVLATTEWGEVTIAEIFGNGDWFIRQGASNANADDILAWMPLPPSYQGE